MSKEAHFGAQLIDGLKQLKINIDALHKIRLAKNMDITAPYTVNTENALKIQYVNEALKGLEL